MLSLTFFGASNTVTGAKFLLGAGNDRVLVECGLFQGLKELRQRNWDGLPFSPAELNAVILTHAHIDHTGYLPRLVRNGFKGPVYATAPTVDLCGILLPDAGELQEEEAAHANAHGYSKHSPALPLYTAADAVACLKYFVRLVYGRRHKVTPDIWLRFTDAGHILGSSIAEVWLDDGVNKRKVVFSGDLGRYGGPILNDPTSIQKGDYVVVEATYGNREHSLDPPERELAEAINGAVDSSSVLLIPAFSVGRTQRILYEIHKLESNGSIPKLPVYVDSPMAIDATNIFLAYPDAHRLEFRIKENADGDHPLACSRLEFVRSPKESAQLDRLDGPAIIISASGMASGGRILNHLAAFLPDPKAIVLFVGFQAEGTRGRALIEGSPEVKIQGRLVPVRAKIKRIEGFSAHGDVNDLLRWLSEFKRPPTKVFLVHGEAAALDSLARRIQQQLGYATHIPAYGERVALDGE